MHGLIHTYLGYDPKAFPPPTAPPPDVASAAFEHMLAYGNLRHLTPEELASAVRLDISQIAGLGPSLESLIAMLEERKRKILETYEIDSPRAQAAKSFDALVRQARPPRNFRDRFDKAARSRQIHDLERLYDDLRDDTSDFAADLVRIADMLGNTYLLDVLADKYHFTGHERTDIEKALALKEELEDIDRLLDQLREALKNARPAVIDMDLLSEFATQEQMESLAQLNEQVAELLRQQALAQGLEQSADGYRLTPEAYRIFQGRLLNEIFSSLEASRSGRHSGPIEGEGPVELPATRPYQFGDPASSMDVAQTFINAALRTARDKNTSPDNPGAAHESDPLHFTPDDIEIHRTRNTPRCATVCILDMSGSMRSEGQYINAKRMALALDGLIRREYPGDSLEFIEMYSLAARRHISEIPALLPRPVTIRQPVVRLRADLGDPELTESQLPPHFTNIQRALQMSRQLLGAQDTPNRQVILITDGLPTAHFEGPMLYLLYPPDPRTEEATMREAALCAREGITINLFLLPSWSQSEDDIQFAHRLAQQTGGRVFFSAGKDLTRFVLWDYVTGRRRILGA